MPHRKSSGQNTFFASFLFLLLSCGFQYGARTLFGWSPDFVLGSLVSFSFFLGFAEILFLGLASAFILNWQPYPSSEILMLAALPLATFGIRKYFPWRIEISHLLSIFFGLFVFYGVSSYGPFLDNLGFFLKSAGWTLLFSAVVFQVFNYFYTAREL